MEFHGEIRTNVVIVMRREGEEPETCHRPPLSLSLSWRPDQEWGGDLIS